MRSTTSKGKLLEGDGHELHVRRGGGRLGVQVQKPGSVLADQLDLPKGQGLVIEQVVPDSAAAKAGLKAHDVLLEFNGKSVPNEAAKFIKMVEEVKANTTVSAIVLRRGKKETIKGISLSEAKTKEEKRFIFGVAPGEGVAPFTFGLPNVGIGVGHGKHGVITTIIRTNDTFTTRYQEGSLVITVTGSVADGKSKVKQIEIQDGGKNETYENADKVPEQYRSKVRNLIEMSEKNNLKVEVGANFDATPKGKPVTIIFEKGNAAAVARAVGRMLPQMRRNPIRIIIPGSETVRRIGSADAGSPGDPNMSLTLTAFGNKLVVACEDQQAQNLVQELSRLLTQTELSDADFEVIKLKTARAADAVKILDEAFNGNNRAMTEQEKRVAGAVRVVADPTTNSMLVRARPAEMVRIRKFVDAFIDKDEANAKPSGTADPSKGN